MNTKLAGLGEITTNFILNDFLCLIMNTSATGGYSSADWQKLGYTEPEKDIDPVQDLYEREDKIPRVVTWRKTIKKGLTVKTGISNYNSDLVALITQGTLVSLGTSTGSQVSHGTQEAVKQFRAVRFVAKMDDGSSYTITIPKADIRQDGVRKIGGTKESVIPLIFKATYNPNAHNTGNLYYEQYLKPGLSATADVPPGFN